MAKKRRHIGSDFDAFLAADGTLDAATAIAVKRVTAWQGAASKKARKITRSAKVGHTGTSDHARNKAVKRSGA
jgi:hypothetical protein